MVTSGASAALGGGIAMLSYPVYLHFLGYAEYGLWVIVSTFITLCQLGSLGIGPALAKLIAEELGQNSREGAQSYVELAISAVMVLGAAMVLFLLLLRAFLLRQVGLTPGMAQIPDALIPLVVILSFYSFLTDVFSAVLTGLGRMDITAMIQTAAQATALGGSFLLLRLGHGVLSLAVGTLASLVLMHLLASIFTWRVGALRLKPGVRLDWKRGRKLLRLSSTVFAAGIAATLFIPFNKLLLSRYVGLAAVPIYEMAFISSMRLRGLFEMATKPIMPLLSHAVSCGGSSVESALDHARRLVQRLILTALATFGFVFLFANPILRLWLRQSLDPAMPLALRVMLVGAFLSLLGVPAYYALLGLGGAVALFWSHVVQSGTNVGVLALALFLGYPLSLTTLLVASAIAMGATTCFLAARYLAAVKALAIAGDSFIPTLLASRSLETISRPAEIVADDRATL
jgi:O-antigen/teichoic acid export membrane protein